jgi:MFS family permease
MKSRGLAMAVLIIAAFMDQMDAMITNVALPTIQRDIGASPAHLEWTLTGYILAFGALMISGGRLGDIFGRQRVFLVGVGGFTPAHRWRRWPKRVDGGGPQLIVPTGRWWDLLAISAALRDRHFPRAIRAAAGVA